MNATLSIPVDAIRIVVTTEGDWDPDTSYLEQPEWEDRLAEYQDGRFGFIGVIATAVADIDPDRPFAKPAELCSHSLWGIEDDSEGMYLREVAADLVKECRRELAQRFDIDADTIPTEGEYA